MTTLLLAIASLGLIPVMEWISKKVPDMTGEGGENGFHHQ